MSPLLLTLTTEEETHSFARKVGSFLEAGDIIALSGDLGAGKSTFARALIQSQYEGPVPSPTFTMVQTYDFRGIPLWHFDLYRLSDPEDAWELGLEEAFSQAISLIEWPERLGSHLPAETFHLYFQEGDNEASRRVRLSLPKSGSCFGSRLKSFDFSPWILENLS